MSPLEKNDNQIRELEQHITTIERWFEVHGRRANKKLRTKRAQQLDDARERYADALRKSMQAALT